MSAKDFPLDKVGVAPASDDGRIPNPLTPTGSVLGPPRTCNVAFKSAAGATSSGVNRWIAAHENTIRQKTVVCLSGTFTSPVHVWGKHAPALLELARAPGASATLDLGEVGAAAADPNEYWGGSGGISIVDSTSVEVYGLTVENYHFAGPAHVPAGILVSVRSDTRNTDQSVVPHMSPCFLHGGSCGDIYIVDDTVRDVKNTADENWRSRALCGRKNVDAYGIAVIVGGRRPLQHVVVEDDNVSGTRTGQSETVTFNGDVKDFLAAYNVIRDVDNIGLDTIGWETGAAQANHGLVIGNTIYNVDTLSNSSYGTWSKGRCRSQPENAAGLYDDGASYIWFDNNVVWNTDQGINLDVETPGRETGHLLVSGNVVHDDPGTSASDPSLGPNPPGTGGRSTVAGHAAFALYVDAFGAGSRIEDVYVHDNVFQNESQHFLVPSWGMPVVDLGGLWSDVQIWHNTIEGGGGKDRYNPLMEVDTEPIAFSIDPIDCNLYAGLSTSSASLNGNFAMPHDSWLRLAAWKAGNGHRWDAESGVGAFPAVCPAASIP